ncbi:proline-rich protein 5-like isoform X3 [Branchiostoma floridae x Branchiostoma belcheri]
MGALWSAEPQTARRRRSRQQLTNLIVSVQSAVVSLFQHKKLPPNELDLLNEKIRMLMKTEVGPFILDYFQNQLLKKGMVILREKIKREKGQQLLESLSDIWDYFFCEVLPMLQAIFCPVQATGFSVREMSLVGFRDTILLKIAFSEALDTQTSSSVPPSRKCCWSYRVCTTTTQNISSWSRWWPE